MEYFASKNPYILCQLNHEHKGKQEGSFEAAYSFDYFDDETSQGIIYYVNSFRQ